jgi:hypothetical protein
MADGTGRRKKFVVFRSFLGDDTSIARLLVQEALACHARNCDGADPDYAAIQTSVSSLKLELGIACGSDLSDILPQAVAIARRAFQQAAASPLLLPDDTNNDSHLQNISRGPLSGLSLLYGLHAHMAPHYDSPTQPGQREEWLAMITLGNTARFRCNDDIIQLHWGDVLVMDSMAVLHGVEGILADHQDPTISEQLGLPVAQARLGILFWQGREQLMHPVEPSGLQEAVYEGINKLFDEADDDC